MFQRTVARFATQPSMVVRPLSARTFAAAAGSGSKRPAAPAQPAQPTQPAQTGARPVRSTPSLFGFTGKQATALFDAAKKSKSLKQVSGELHRFRQAYDSTPAIRQVFQNPLFDAKKRADTLNQVFPKIDVKAEATKKFILSLAENKGLAKLKQIATDFDKLVQFELKEVRSRIISSEPLKADQVSRIEKALKSRLNSGESLIVSTEVDPSILGGLRVTLDNQILDLSVASTIKQLDKAIRA